MKRFLAAFLVVVVAVACFVAAYRLLPLLTSNSGVRQDFHFGVSFGGNTTADAEVLIDRVRNFTNLFVVQSGPASTNETMLNEVVNYAVASDLDVVVYFGYFNPDYPWQIPWLDYANQTWGSRLLGVYIHDEPGGTVIDANWTSYFKQLSIRNSSLFYEHQPSIELALNGSLPLNKANLDQAAYHFVTELKNDPYLAELRALSIPSFTSDYALFWFDYLGGYDTILGEFGSNQSISQAIAQTRGAAYLQNKTWGAIVTWTYDQPPYIVNGTETYRQLNEAYTAGANYAIIFDYPTITGNPYGILTEQHFVAMQKFWNDLPNLPLEDKAEAVLVWPQNFGSAMRSPKDSIWGLWPADSASQQVWDITQKLLAQYGSRLDIVYPDTQFPLQGKYQQVYCWNQTS